MVWFKNIRLDEDSLERSAAEARRSAEEALAASRNTAQILKRFEAETQARAEAEAKAKAEMEAARISVIATFRSVAEAKTKAEADRKARIAAYTESDSRRNGWPALDDNLLTDPLRGHWDLWGRNDANVEEIDGQKLYGRDPARDIQENMPVCIDFGTSSTVVAARREGKPHLLRVGVSDWLEMPKASHFENPTSLEFVDAQKFAEVWNGEYYRPETSWADLKCAHEARSGISPLAPALRINSIIRDIKTWARMGQKRLEMRDGQGQAFTLGEDLDPLAIYAFHLGLALNNQYVGNGRIYHEYYLSFPATFTKELRRQILASFATGLERSLPKSLGDRTDWRGKTPFAVLEGVDEPVAYAAAVLGEGGLEPEDNGLAFGVFDFGGGTTDFAFGLYRWATPEEEQKKSWEAVIDLLDVSGLENLGGENLLHNLAHMLVLANLPEIAAARIPFTAAGEIPPGAERVFGDGLLARSNSMRLCEALRPFWEEGPEAIDSEGEGVLRIPLQSVARDGDISVSLKIDKEAMAEFLRARVVDGVGAFFAAFRQAFKSHHPDVNDLHILLAGNSSRSPLVREAFEAQIAAFARDECINPQSFILHEPLLPDEARPEAVTLKTGVALGQLNTVPGEATGVIRVADPDDVFRHCFGIFKRKKLQPLLTRFSDPLEWVALGLVRDDLRLIAAWSDSPVAIEGEMARGDAALNELVIRFKDDERGRPVFARPHGPTAVEIAVGDANGEIGADSSRIIALGDENRR